MQEFLEFIQNHWGLVLAFVLVLGWWVGGELFHWYSGVKPVDGDAATRLYNRESARFIDMRPRKEYDSGHLPGAFSLPEAEFDQLIDKLRKEATDDPPLIVYDEHGPQAARLGRKLRKAGFSRVYRLKHGLRAWQGGGYPMEQGKKG
ncbi:MAG: rhodanese-like domain-containing protein [Halorhodospira sp.]